MKQIYSAKCVVEGCNNIAMYYSNLCAIHRKQYKKQKITKEDKHNQSAKD